MENQVGDETTPLGGEDIDKELHSSSTNEENNTDVDQDEEAVYTKGELLYRVEDRPAWHLCIMFGFQVNVFRYPVIQYHKIYISVIFNTVRPCY